MGLGAGSAENGPALVNSRGRKHVNKKADGQEDPAGLLFFLLKSDSILVYSLARF